MLAEKCLAWGNPHTFVVEVLGVKLAGNSHNINSLKNMLISFIFSH